jgi:membrane protease YdiL (CAAX protease family)
MPTIVFSQALSLVHTGVALGVIPAVITLVLMPSLPYEIQHVSQTSPGLYGATPTIPMVVGSLFLIAAWSAFTEEIIFRGCILSALRRASVIRSARHRDYIAVVASGLLFGISHIPVWGPAMGLALSGFGLGLGVAYVAAGEALLPVILYHWGFNFLSLLVATFLGRIR